MLDTQNTFRETDINHKKSKTRLKYEKLHDEKFGY